MPWYPCGQNGEMRVGWWHTSKCLYSLFNEYTWRVLINGFKPTGSLGLDEGRTHNSHFFIQNKGQDRTFNPQDNKTQDSKSWQARTTI